VLLPRTGVDNEQGLSLERKSGCWYVTSVGQGDGLYSARFSTGYAGVGSERRAFLHLPTDLVPWAGSFGVGSVERRFDRLPARPEGGGVMLTLPASEGDGGHYFLGTPETGSHKMDQIQGGVIAPPFDPADVPVVPSPERSREILFDVVERQPGCRGWNWEEYSSKHAIRQTLPVAKHYSAAAPRYELRQEGPGKYVATLLDELHVTFEFWRPAKGCKVLGRISSSETASRVTEVRADPDACAVSIDWGRADEVYAMCRFGEIYLDGTVAKIEGPIQFGLQGTLLGVDPRKEGSKPGSYLVAFYDDGEMIDLEGGALPPFDDLP
jgi:hypothetical protein